jgi:polyisoprenoid-binding protein YceI
MRFQQARFCPIFGRRPWHSNYSCFPCSACLALPATALDYVIDPSHTYASFEIDHLGFSHAARSVQRTTSGQVGFDLEEARAAISTSASTPPRSIPAGPARRHPARRCLVQRRGFPDILFRSQHLVFDQERLIAVEGS